MLRIEVTADIHIAERNCCEVRAMFWARLSGHVHAPFAVQMGELSSKVPPNFLLHVLGLRYHKFIFLSFKGLE